MKYTCTLIGFLLTATASFAETTTRHPADYDEPRLRRTYSAPVVMERKPEAYKLSHTLQRRATEPATILLDAIEAAQPTIHRSKSFTNLQALADEAEKNAATTLRRTKSAIF